jgi:hypothetical protein
MLTIHRIPRPEITAGTVAALSLPRRDTALSGRPGAVVLEFSLIAVLLVFIVLGMIETSRGVMVKETMSNAARSVCRLAILGKGSNEMIETEAKKVLKEHNLPEPQAQITILVNGKEGDVAAAKRYDKITVIVTMPVSEVYWVSALFLSKETKLSESVTMMRQG